MNEREQQTSKQSQVSSSAEWLVAASVACSALLVLALDVSVELGFAGGALYVGVVALSLNSRRSTASWETAVVCSTLTWIGFFLSPQGGEQWKVVGNRIVAMFAIWVTAVLVMRLKRIPNPAPSVVVTPLVSPFDGKSKTRDINQLGRTLWILIGISLAIHIACLILGNTLLAGFRWPHDPVHAAVEMAGGLTAMWVAWMLLILQRRGKGTTYNVWIAGALIGMGILDILHAMVHAGQAFVWLHSTATFVGGVLFTLVWLPARWQNPAFKWWPSTVAAVTLAFGVWSLSFPEFTPQMLRENAEGQKVFTLWSQVLNVVGGLLLFMAAFRLLLTWRQTKNVDDLLFFLHCLLFGAAAVMFEQSQLWDLPWWGWHLLRMLAYGVALWFVVLSDLRDAEDLRRRAIETSQFFAIVESSDDAILGITLDGMIVSWNHGAELLYGYAESEVVGKPISVIAPKDNVAETLGILKQLKDGATVNHCETQRITKSGNLLDVSLTISPIRDGQGQLVGASSIARDITERKRLHRDQIALNETLERLVAERTHDLTQSNADLEQFAYVASHDLQEPLRAVVGFSQLLAKELDAKTEDIELFLTNIVEGGQRMQRLIEDLLEYSRINRKGSPFELVSVGPVIDDAIANLNAAIVESSSEVIVGPMPKAVIDQRQFRQLFQNIIGNAIKYRSDRVPRIEIRCNETPVAWVFEVEDNGIGIEPRFHDQIFEIFKRLHTRSTYSGTGIGLALCKRIVDRHAGTISVSSEPSEGSTFQVAIPKNQPETEESPTHA